MKRRKRLNPVSRKLRAGKAKHDAVYAAVDARSGGRCEYRWIGNDLYHNFLTELRCLRPAAEHHHTRKPRRSYHAPEWVVGLCRAHHDRCEGKYALGRLVVTPCGDGTFTFSLVYARSKWDKWEARG